jgi:uncharacterized protein with HEPN domain
MSNHDPQFYKSVIVENIDAIKSNLPDSKDAFLNDRMAFEAILSRLVVVGHALSVLQDSLEEQYPQLEWHRIIGPRNRIAHGYGDVDKDAVWELLTDGSLDELRKALQ